MMTSTPAAAIDRTKYLDTDEVQRLRTVTEARAITDLQAGRVTGVVSWMIVDLALSTGLRVSELASITHEDIDLRRGCIAVGRLKKRSKGKDGRETLAIGKELSDHLRDFMAWKETLGGDDEGEGVATPLFVGKRGPMTSRGLQQAWKQAIKRAGLPESLSIHSARHTLAVALLKRTGNLRMVQKQLGHSSPATTANMYADVSFEDMQAGVTGLYGGE